MKKVKALSLMAVAVGMIMGIMGVMAAMLKKMAAPADMPVP
jgi:hypothetical protein